MIIALPFSFTPEGGVATVSSAENIARQQLLTLLLTSVGERVMHPQYGSRLPAFVWESPGQQDVDALMIDLRDAIGAFAPGVRVTDIRIDDADDLGEFLIEIDYQASGFMGTLTVPTAAISEGF